MIVNQSKTRWQRHIWRGLFVLGFLAVTVYIVANSWKFHHLANHGIETTGHVTQIALKHTSCPYSRYRNKNCTRFTAWFGYNAAGFTYYLSEDAGGQHGITNDVSQASLTIGDTATIVYSAQNPSIARLGTIKSSDVGQYLIWLAYIPFLLACGMALLLRRVIKSIQSKQRNP